MGNPNTELLTWAVENITEWNDDYTHLRSDSSLTPFYTERNSQWYLSRGGWTTNQDYHAHFKNLDKEFSTKTPQVITKQEYIDAVNALKTACKPQQGHIHAELMAEYAIVAKTNPEPWKEFEMQYVATGDWLPMNCADSFLANYKYRRKPSPPKTMKIGDIVVEACPLKHMPSPSGEYWSLGVDQNGFRTYRCRYQVNSVSKFDENMLYNGQAFATQQEAQAVADALNNIYKKAVDEAWNSL